MKSGITGPIALCVVLAGCAADDGGSPADRMQSNLTPPDGRAGGTAMGTGGAKPAAGSGGRTSASTAGSGGDASAGSGGDASSGMSGAGGTAMTAGTGGMGSGGMTSRAGSGGSAAPAGDLCARWKSDRADLSEGTWSGDAASCEAGDISADARETAHRLVNLYRFMAGLDPVEMTDEGNRLAQGCALLMTANGMISHTPDSSWKCYTAEAAKTAGSSSLSGGGAVSSVDGYMIDPGNPTTIGHRRWVLSNMLASIGFGSSGQFSCQYQPPKRPAAGAKPWVAWPPAGQLPIQAMGNRWSSIDQTGWTVQSDSVDLKSAQVTVTAGGMDLPVTVTTLGSGYGSTYAIRFNPMGWTSEAGTTYSVKLSGTSMPIEYDVEIIDCP
jgi:hypothetical protein